MSYPKTRLRHLNAIQHGAPRYKELMRIARIEFSGFTDMDLIVLASLAYYRLATGSAGSNRSGLTMAFHLHAAENGFPVDDVEKRAALRAFYSATKDETWFRWRKCLEDLWRL